MQGQSIHHIYSVSCYNTVIAFDIQQDGSIGTIPVPGDIVSSYENMECLPRTLAVPSESRIM